MSCLVSKMSSIKHGFVRHLKGLKGYLRELGAKMQHFAGILLKIASKMGLFVRKRLKYPSQ